MDKIKSEQLQNKIYDYMLSIDLSKLSLYELIPYINAYKALEGSFPFPGFGLGLGCSSSDTSAV